MNLQLERAKGALSKGMKTGHHQSASAWTIPALEITRKSYRLPKRKNSSMQNYQKSDSHWALQILSGLFK